MMQSKAFSWFDLNAHVEFIKSDQFMNLRRKMHLPEAHVWKPCNWFYLYPKTSLGIFQMQYLWRVEGLRSGWGGGEINYYAIIWPLLKSDELPFCLKWKTSTLVFNSLAMAEWHESKQRGWKPRRGWQRSKACMPLINLCHLLSLWKQQHQSH